MLNANVKLFLVYSSVANLAANNGVGRTQLGHYMGCTPATVAKRMDELITNNLVAEYRISLPRGMGFKFAYNLTPKGCAYLDEHYEQIYADYTAWKVARLQATMDEIKANLRVLTHGKKIKVSDEQLQLFGDD